ncbi:nucleoside triphosphate pyrophosphohydrolase [Acuticoccus sp.]|uniref:nucleoside triphosphate pyrophosphohydrolase n=1 Tax=Acuticoccus sp. TaxID=1904378 RepID=UPI003B521E9D
MQDTPIERLRRIMARLRDPERGCAWDREQSYGTIAPYTLEEAYEVADAIERGDVDDIRDECGDLLLQVVFLSQIGAEAGDFTFDDVATSISDKLVRRHPHVFADGAARTPDEIKVVWDAIKAEERVGKPAGIIDGVPVDLPPLMRAQKLQKRLAKVGFDWSGADDVVDKVGEELEEFVVAVRDGDGPSMEAEFGDLLFTLANLARHLGIDAHAALRGSNARFAARVRHMDDAARRAGTTLGAADAPTLEQLWSKAKDALAKHPTTAREADG